MNINENYLDGIFEDFKQKIVHLNFTQGFTKSVSEAALSNLKKNFETAKEQDSESSLSRMTNMICYDIAKNQKGVIGSKDASYAEHFQILLLQHNRQYQWLLAEAYEAFEDYLKKLYAYSGYMDNDFWEKNDFKNKTIDEMRMLKLDWFVEKARNKQGLPESILKRLNAKIPAISQILATRKRDDPLNIDYEFTIILVSKLRHKIVHAQGYAVKEDFINSRLHEWPLANKSDAEKQVYINDINSLFGNGQFEDLISLLEVPDPSIKVPMMYVDRLGDLLARIASYAMLLHHLIRSQSGANVTN